jgi:hypothetical protein
LFWLNRKILDLVWLEFSCRMDQPAGDELLVFISSSNGQNTIDFSTYMLILLILLLNLADLSM